MGAELDQSEGAVSVYPAGGALVPAHEVVIPHLPDAGPLVAVRNVLVQSSLAVLKRSGHYERYVQQIAPETLEVLLANLGPGWIPLELAAAHYQACDDLMLSDEQLAHIGTLAGERVQEATLVSAAKRTRDADFDLWSAMSALHRVWGRLYQGGSVQVSRLGPREKLVEMRGFHLNRYRYFRQGLLAVIAASYSALGPRITAVKIVSFSPKSYELVLRTSWA